MKRAFLVVIILGTFVLVSFLPAPEKKSILKWREMCIPFSHITAGGSFGFMYHGPSSTRIRLRIPSEEIQAGIPNWKPNGLGWEGQFVDELITVWASPSTGMSDGDKIRYHNSRVEQLIKQDSSYFRIEGSEFPAIKDVDTVGDNFYLFKYEISADEARLIDPFQWVKAHCIRDVSENDKFTCFARRQYNDLSYDYNLDHPNIDFFEAFDNHIQAYLKKWEDDCKEET